MEPLDQKLNVGKHTIRNNSPIKIHSLHFLYPNHTNSLVAIIPRELIQYLPNKLINLEINWPIQLLFLSINYHQNLSLYSQHTINPRLPSKTHGGQHIRWTIEGVERVIRFNKLK